MWLLSTIARRSSRHAMCPLSTITRREHWARYVPSVDRWPLYPLETRFSVFSRLFRVFSCFLRFRRP